MNFTILTLVTLTLATLTFFNEEVNGGYPGFLCPVNSTSTQVFFKCADDCIHQHGAKGGRCGKVDSKKIGRHNYQPDYNCYCGEPDPNPKPESLHCIEDKGKYRELCVVDCQCSHGAKTGVCDFERKACYCKGKDEKNSLCQMKNVVEFADFTAAVVPIDSPAWSYLTTFVQKPRICDANGNPI